MLYTTSVIPTPVMLFGRKDHQTNAYFHFISNIEAKIAIAFYYVKIFMDLAVYFLISM